MDRKNRQRTAAGLRSPRSLNLVAFLLLAAGMMGGCQTMKPDNDVLDRLRTWSLSDPPNRLSAAHELSQEKAAMKHWLERYVRGQYRVIDERFVLSWPDFTKWAALESQAGQYMEQELHGTYLRQDWQEIEKLEHEWKDAEINRISLWRLDRSHPRYFALVMTREPLPGPDERKLVGYFELIPFVK